MFKFNALTGKFDLVNGPPDLSIYAKLDGSNQPFTGDIIVGTILAGKNLSIIATEGAEKMPALISNLWVLGAGWSYATSPNRLAKTLGGTSACSPNVGGVSPTVGKTYKVVVSITVSAQTMSWTYGGITIKTGATTGTYTDYITAKTTDNFNIWTPLTSGRGSLDALSIVELTDATGDLNPFGNLKLVSPVLDYDGNEVFNVWKMGAFFNRGVGINVSPSAFATASTTARLLVNGFVNFGAIASLVGHTGHVISAYQGSAGSNVGGLFLYNGGASAGSGINIAMRLGSSGASLYAYMDAVLADASTVDWIVRTTSATTGTTEKLRVKGTGEVGINNPNPTKTLDVIGTGKIGSANNYSEFEVDGTYRMKGRASVYNDLEWPVVGVVSDSNPPDFVSFTNNTKAYAFEAMDSIDLYCRELPHSAFLGGMGYFHVHFALTAQAPKKDTYVAFKIYLALANRLEVGTATTFTEQEIYVQVLIPGYTPALTHFYATTEPFDLRGYDIETLMNIRLMRDDPQGGEKLDDMVYGLQVGCHLEDDTIGSRDETIK